MTAPSPHEQGDSDVRDVTPIRLSFREKARLAKAAVLRGLKLSAYIRTAALEQAAQELDAPRERVVTLAARGDEGESRRRTETTPAPTEPDEDGGVLSEWAQDRLARGLPDGASFEEWKAGGLGLGGAMRE